MKKSGSFEQLFKDVMQNYEGEKAAKLLDDYRQEVSRGYKPTPIESWLERGLRGQARMAAAKQGK